jgi:hypothetical protein
MTNLIDCEHTQFDQGDGTFMTAICNKKVGLQVMTLLEHEGQYNILRTGTTEDFSDGGWLWSWETGLNGVHITSEAEGVRLLEQQGN